MSSILIKNAYIISMKAPISKADVLIEDGIISSIGDIDSKADQIIDATGKVLMPGFVNAHSHIGMSLFRSYKDEVNLDDYFEKIVEPIEEKMTEEDIYNASLLSMIEMIKSGTTTFNDIYIRENKVAEAISKSGMRAYISKCIEGDGEKADKEIDEAAELYNNWNNKEDERIKVAIGLRSSTKCSISTITKASQKARDLNTFININFLENKNEINKIREEYNKSVIDYIKEGELFRGKSLLSYGVWADEYDISELILHDTSIVNCPLSNSKLGTGIADIKLLTENGINCALGTDGLGTTGTLDMFEAVKQTLYSQKLLYKDSSAMRVETALKMATINGAKALGLEDSIGTIEVGKKADLIIINLQKSYLLPVHDIYSTIAYSVTGRDVETTIIDGKIIMKDRKILTIDEEEVLENVYESLSNLFSEE